MLFRLVGLCFVSFCVAAIQLDEPIAKHRPMRYQLEAAFRSFHDFNLVVLWLRPADGVKATYCNWGFSRLWLFVWNTVVEGKNVYWLLKLKLRCLVYVEALDSYPLVQCEVLGFQTLVTEMFRILPSSVISKVWTKLMFILIILLDNLLETFRLLSPSWKGPKLGLSGFLFWSVFSHPVLSRRPSGPVHINSSVK